MIYDHDYDVWTVWLGQEYYCIQVNDQMDMMFGDHYLNVRITCDLQGNWTVLIEELTTLILRKYEVYKVRYTLFSFEEEAPIKKKLLLRLYKERSSSFYPHGSPIETGNKMGIFKLISML